MQPMELARRMAELGQKEDAQRAYSLALQKQELTPMERFEAASYIFFSRGDYKVAYTTFVQLYNEGHYQAELMDIMTQAFYLPNADKLRRRYEDNLRVLSAYPYCFRKDFPAFHDLPLRFFPFDDNGYLPFAPVENRFGDYVDFNDPVIDRYFFKDLENPILAKDVYSQYQLEYLNDTVRKSEWVGRENHIYLHYTDFARFCAFLQCLELRPLLREEKLVFLFEEEIGQYPIDFAARFGIDYSRYPLRPIGIREVNRLIWHTQLSAHNGGDFFNEIFYGHPNLLSYESVMFDSYRELVAQMRAGHRKNPLGDEINRQLTRIKHPTDKDFLVALFLNHADTSSGLDRASRIVPALFFQPHFKNIEYTHQVDQTTGACVLHSNQYEEIKSFPFFQQFKYIKTFAPMRRPTTSYAATVRFMVAQTLDDDSELRVPDMISDRLLNRSYLRDPEDRLFRDSVLVRFEDGKLNPTATFTALARFLDLPYTESMTYCSSRKGLNPESLEGNVRGFDPATVYRTYDEYAGDADRAFLEFFLRDIYETYGYDFHYYGGEPVDETWVVQKLDQFQVPDSYIRESFYKANRHALSQEGKLSEQMLEDKVTAQCNQYMLGVRSGRLLEAKLLLNGLHFVSAAGQPMRPMPLLHPDPALLEQPLYH